MSKPLENLLPGYFRVFQGADGSFVDIHETHGKLESRQNLPIALFLAARGEQVRLLPVHDLQGVKSPDATRDDIEWEFKAPEGRTANAIDQALRGAARQAARVLMQVAQDFDRQLLERATHSRVRRAANLVEVAFLLSNELPRFAELHHFSRQEILDQTFRGRMG